ncbi:MAG: LPS export ABC transporter periplasmic protein LptC [Betaproteobacteria bacterium]|nr:LPS export ABC transporter periplasmic protein LptC [Pseudomonadota bacterium]NBO12907.1 LPS export ABC transporter periplasmic protein LptC [Betaproteobacteria bacterium]NBO43828.1 LPS export ABC transporter periplasmic protein LptC [Betaproteobacteria bacterium]NBP10194.1 LPS export ABC transporter periplasmic protein LptC [Betaproteobacteria bacterium]NBP62532.1 LPS export ABC transporter periplasmic protein LptC [Betaproteobacteria bacterium]
MPRLHAYALFRHRLSWPQLALLFSLAVMAGSSAYLAFELSSRQNVRQTVLARGQADYYASGVHILRYNHQGIASMQLRADRLEHIPDREELKLSQPRLWLSDEQSDTQVSAREGYTSDDGQRARLNGSVVIIRKTQDAPSLKIQSEQAVIDASNDQIVLPDTVRIEQGDGWVTGQQLLLDQAQKQLRLDARVQAFFPPNPSLSAAEKGLAQ